MVERPPGTMRRFVSRVRAVGCALVSRTCVRLSRRSRERARDDARRACSARRLADAPREGALGFLAPRYTREKTSEMNRTIWASWSELPEPIEFNTSMAGTIPFMWRCSLYFLRNSWKNQMCGVVNSITGIHGERTFCRKRTKRVPNQPLLNNNSNSDNSSDAPRGASQRARSWPT